MVISIIALLIGILLPALGSARATARQSACLSNIRQLGIALHTYATDNKDAFPPSNQTVDPRAGTSSNNQIDWFDLGRIGYYLPEELVIGTGGPSDSFGGSILVCPSDIDGAARSYAMNAFASSNQGGAIPPLSDTNSDYFDAAVIDATKTILMGESWSRFQVGSNWYSAPVLGVGAVGGDPQKVPAVRFGGNAGQNIALPLQRFPASPARSTIDFTRHADTLPGELAGNANFAFADGHAESVQAETLVDDMGYSTLEVVWSPHDEKVTP